MSQASYLSVDYLGGDVVRCRVQDGRAKILPAASATRQLRELCKSLSINNDTSACFTNPAFEVPTSSDKATESSANIRRCAASIVNLAAKFKS
jgi:hypothetical protein